MYALSINRTGALMIPSVSVWSRLYRRIFWSMLRLIQTDRHVPRHFGSLSVFLIFLLSVFCGLSYSGRMENVAKALALSIGLVVTDVSISGNKRMAEHDILKILGLNERSFIVDFNVDEARSVLEQHVWIQSASVQKIYPNRVRISLIERKPYAVWQHGGVMDIVDETGHVIVPFQDDLVQGLPLIVGQGAPGEARSFIQAISQYPQVSDHVRAYVRVGGRRWDIFLNNGIRLMLPEKGAIDRIAFFIKTGMAKDLFSRDVLSIDLRLSDRITVALSSETLARHRAAVAEEEHLLKRRHTESL